MATVQLCREPRGAFRGGTLAPAGGAAADAINTNLHNPHTKSKYGTPFGEGERPNSNFFHNHSALRVGGRSRASSGSENQNDIRTISGRGTRDDRSCSLKLRRSRMKQAGAFSCFLSCHFRAFRSYKYGAPAMRTSASNHVCASIYHLYVCTSSPCPGCRTEARSWCNRSCAWPSTWGRDRH